MQKCILFFALVVILGCSSRWNADFLIGKWQTSSWKVVGTGQTIDQRMQFTFKNDDNYEVDYGSEVEAGTYYLAGEYLHTKESGAIEKSVRVLKLTKDSLVLEMNRAGSLEELILVKT